MKKLMILLLFGLTLTTRAATVWWVHSFSPDAVVHDKTGTYSITEYAETVLGDTLYNVAYIVRDVATGSYLDFQFPGLVEPDVYDINWVEMTDDEGNSFYVQNNQVAIGEVDMIDQLEDWSSFSKNWTDEIVVELSLYDEDNDTFTKFAYSDIFTMSDIRRGFYGQGTVDHNPEVITSLINFYTDDYVPVPEPSIIIFTMIGLCVLWLRRKNAEQV